MTECTLRLGAHTHMDVFVWAQYMYMYFGHQLTGIYMYVMYAKP